MKRIIAVLMAVLMLTTCIPVIGFAAEEITVALADETAGTAIDWTQPNTIDVVFSGGEVDPESVTAENITLTEYDGTVSNVAIVIEDATSTTAKIKIGKLRAMEKYNLTFNNIKDADGDTVGEQSILLKSDEADMFGWWEPGDEYGIHSDGGKPPYVKNPDAAYTFAMSGISDGNLHDVSETNPIAYRQYGGNSQMWITRLGTTSVQNGQDLGDITYEYWGKVENGFIKLGGFCNDYDYNVVLKPDTFTSYNSANENKYAYKAGDFVHLRIIYYKKTDGKYYQSVFVDGGDNWVKMGGEKALNITSLVDHSSHTNCSRTTSFKKFGTAELTNGSYTIDTVKAGIYTTHGAEILDYNVDLANKQITLTMDKKMADGAKDAITLMNDGTPVVDAVTETTDDVNYTISWTDDLAPLSTYTVAVENASSLEGPLSNDEFTFDTPADPRVRANVIGATTNLNWKTSNTINVEFTAPVDPDSVNETTVTLKEADGTVCDAPMLIESDGNTAAITIGKLRALADYDLSIKGIEPADSEKEFVDTTVRIETASTDIVEHWIGGRGKNGPVDDAAYQADFNNLASYSSTTAGSEEGTGSYRVYSNTTSQAFSWLFNTGVSDVDFEYEYKIRVMAGNIGTAGNTRGEGDAAVKVTPDTFSVFGTAYPEYTPSSWVHYRVRYYKKADGYYYGKVYLNTVEDGERVWKEVGPETKRSFTEFGCFGSYTTRNAHTNIGQGGSSKLHTIHTKIAKINTIAKTGIMKSEFDEDENVLTLVMDQKLANGQENNIKIKYDDDVLDTTATTDDNITYTVKINEKLTPGAEYAIDLSSVEAACGTVGGQAASFTAPIDDVEVTAMSIGDGRLTSSVTLKNNTNKKQNVTIILALYNKNTNQMVKASYLPKEVPVGDPVTFADVAITGVTASADHEAKLMVWLGDIGDVVPLCPAITK